MIMRKIPLTIRRRKKVADRVLKLTYSKIVIKMVDFLKLL